MVIGADEATGEFLCRRHSGQAANSEDADASTGLRRIQRTPAGSAWCLIPRKPLFLRPEAPRPQPKQRRRRDRRGASSPANPCSFVRKHHAPESKRAAGGTGVVPHPLQTLIPSSRGTTPSAQTAPPARPAWCLTPRKPLFLRPDAPRPRAK